MTVMTPEDAARAHFGDIAEALHAALVRFESTVDEAFQDAIARHIDVLADEARHALELADGAAYDCIPSAALSLSPAVLERFPDRAVADPDVALSIDNWTRLLERAGMDWMRLAFSKGLTLRQGFCELIRWAGDMEERLDLLRDPANLRRQAACFGNSGSPWLYNDVFGEVSSKALASILRAQVAALPAETTIEFGLAVDSLDYERAILYELAGAKLPEGRFSATPDTPEWLILMLSNHGRLKLHRDFGPLERHIDRIANRLGK